MRTFRQKTLRQTRRPSPGAGGNIMSQSDYHIKPRKQNKKRNKRSILTQTTIPYKKRNTMEINDKRDTNYKQIKKELIKINNDVEEPRGSKHQSNIERSHPIEDQIKIMKPKTKGVNKSEVFRSSNKTTRKKYDEHKIKQTEEPTHTNQHRFSKTELNTNTTKNTQSGYKKACYDETEAISIDNINERNDSYTVNKNDTARFDSHKRRCRICTSETKFLAATRTTSFFFTI
jgi:hypothetical protein